LTVETYFKGKADSNLDKSSLREALTRAYIPRETKKTSKKKVISVIVGVR
jgi:hypothetical protein